MEFFERKNIQIRTEEGEKIPDEILGFENNRVFINKKDYLVFCFEDDQGYPYFSINLSPYYCSGWGTTIANDSIFSPIINGMVYYGLNIKNIEQKQMLVAWHYYHWQLDIVIAPSLKYEQPTGEGLGFIQNWQHPIRAIETQNIFQIIMNKEELDVFIKKFFTIETITIPIRDLLINPTPELKINIFFTRDKLQFLMYLFKCIWAI